MSAETRGLIANFRAEAKRLRQLAKEKRALARELRSGKIGSRDMLGALKAEDAARDYIDLAEGAESLAAELRAEIGGAS